jgi:hypothetical protein
MFERLRDLRHSSLVLACRPFHLPRQGRERSRRAADPAQPLY